MRRTADAGGISGSVRDTVGRTDQGHLRLDADIALSTLYGAESGREDVDKASALLPWFCVATGVGSAPGPGLTCYPA
jgi:hypothetical protein